MKPLNCMCVQCKAMRRRKALYMVVMRRARRTAKAAIQRALRRRDYDIDMPVKVKGIYAA